jgi:hypothetical protein
LPQTSDGRNIPTRIAPPGGVNETKPLPEMPEEWYAPVEADFRRASAQPVLRRSEEGDEPQPAGIDIHVWAANQKGYPVEVSVPGAGAAPITQLSLDLPRLHGPHTEPPSSARALGRAFFEPSGVWNDLQEAVDVLATPRGDFRVRLRLDPPELEPLPWEWLFCPQGGYRSAWASLFIPPLFSRYLPARALHPRPRRAEQSLRMLAVISSPSGLQGSGRHKVTNGAIRALLAALKDLPGVSLTCLGRAPSGIGMANPPTRKWLQAELGKGCTLIHFLGHGDLPLASETGSVLFLEDERGRVDRIPLTDLMELFRPLTGPLFCFLTADLRNPERAGDPLPYLARALVRTTSVQAVVALRDPLEREASRTFTANFYPRLLEHGVVDRAVAEALAAVGGTWEGMPPVLYSSRADNRFPELVGDPTEVS